MWSGFGVLRRSPMHRGTRRLGQAAIERVRAGGKLAVGRESVSLIAWRAIVGAVKARAHGLCEVGGWVHRGDDPDHVVPRSAGGADRMENVIFLCRFHHEQKNWEFSRGRLLIRADGRGGFDWQIKKATNKWVRDMQIIAAGTVVAK